MSHPFGLFLLSHADIRTRPDRTQSALRVFFPAEAEQLMRQLGHGEGVLIRRGKRDALAALAARLSAQGFNTTLRELEHAA